MNAMAVASTSVAQGATSAVLVINIQGLLVLSSARRDYRSPIAHAFMLLSMYQ